MTFELLAILLLVVGCGLIVAEIFIPSGGMILVLCVVSFIASIWCAYKAWWGVEPAYFGTYVVSLVVLIPAVLIGVYKLLSDTRVGDRILLSGPSLDEVTPYQTEQAHLEQFVGQRGTTLTLLTPGGMVNVGGERLHAFSEGMLIEPGETIEVIAVRGTRVMVRTVGGDSTPSDPQTAASDGFPDDDAPGPQRTPLDFDLPQG